ncbi:unnamed protein product [Closterium sp. Yama58-4]|nr:unnamed protein product [Closterium sp. Yama58-4]
MKPTGKILAMLIAPDTNVAPAFSQHQSVSTRRGSFSRRSTSSLIACPQPLHHTDPFASSSVANSAIPSHSFATHSHAAATTSPFPDFAGYGNQATAGLSSHSRRSSISSTGRLSLAAPTAALTNPFLEHAVVEPEYTPPTAAPTALPESTVQAITDELKSASAPGAESASSAAPDARKPAVVNTEDARKRAMDAVIGAGYWETEFLDRLMFLEADPTFTQLPADQLHQMNLSQELPAPLELLALGLGAEVVSEEAIRKDLHAARMRVVDALMEAQHLERVAQMYSHSAGAAAAGDIGGAAATAAVTKSRAPAPRAAAAGAKSDGTARRKVPKGGKAAAAASPKAKKASQEGSAKPAEKAGELKAALKKSPALKQWLKFAATI